MDAKTIRSLAGLAVLSLLCATAAWAMDDALFSGVFFALGVVGIFGAAYRRWP